MKKTALMMALAGLTACQGEPSTTIVATGTIEATEIDVAALTAGRVAAIRVQEGDTVEIGDTIALLTRAETAGELDAGRARVDAARARQRLVEAGPRQQEIASARAQLRGAEGDLRSAEREAERTRQLVRDSLATPRDLDRVEAALSLARSRRETAAEALAVLSAGSREEERASARADLQAAEAAYAQMRAAAGELVVTSGGSGIVQLRNYEPGEVAPAGAPLVTLIDPRDRWVRIYVQQDALVRLRVGQTIPLEADALPGQKFDGEVVEISPRAEFIPRVALTEKERADLVFAVKLRVRDATGRLRPGMPVDALIPAPGNDSR